MSDERRIICPDCDAGDGLSRRDFVRKVTGAALAGSLLPLVGMPRRVVAAPTPTSPAETTVKRFYDSLTEEQRKVICFPFDDKLRTKINANWAITKPTIAEYFTKEQQSLIDDVFKNVTSPEGCRAASRSRWKTTRAAPASITSPSSAPPARASSSGR